MRSPRVLFVVLAALTGCGAARAPERAPRPVVQRRAAPAVPSTDESFRAHAPEPGPRPPFVPNAPSDVRLANGMRVLVVERHDLPLVSVQLLVPHGTDDAPGAVGRLAMQAMLEGHRDAAGRTARERFDALAVRASTWAAFDSVGLRIDCVRDVLDDALAIAADVLRHPSVAPRDLERAREDLLTRLEKDRAAIGVVHEWAQRAALYPAGHPYRGAARSRLSDLREPTVANANAFLRARLSPDGMTVVGAGDVRAEELGRALDTAFSGWRGPHVTAPPPPRAPTTDAKGPRVFFVDWPAAGQTHVAVVAPAVARSSPEHAAAVVTNRILGGGVASRLWKSLRERSGLSYGPWSSVTARRAPGEVVAGGAVIRDKSGQAIRILLEELETLRTLPVPPDELRAVEAGLVGEIPAQFETWSGLLWTYGEMPVHGFPFEEIAGRAARIEAVSAEDVQRFARSHLAAEELRIVVTGDASVVRKDLESLGLGPITELKPTDL